MKKMMTLVLSALCITSSMYLNGMETAPADTSPAWEQQEVAALESVEAAPADVQSAVVQKALTDTSSFVTDNKRALLILGTAVVVALSLKYCSWVRGLVGLDTEDEITDLKLYLQD